MCARYIYLAVPRLSCGTWHLSVLAMQTLSCGIWDLAPWPGKEPSPLHWACGVLATGSYQRSARGSALWHNTLDIHPVPSGGTWLHWLSSPSLSLPFFLPFPLSDSLTQPFLPTATLSQTTTLTFYLSHWTVLENLHLVHSVQWGMNEATLYLIKEVLESLPLLPPCFKSTTRNSRLLNCLLLSNLPIRT